MSLKPILSPFSHNYNSHHESRALNLLNRSPTLVWFTNNLSPFPQHIILKLSSLHNIKKLGFYIHGQNNQNPKHIQFQLGKVNKDGEYVTVVDEEIPQRAGDYLYDLNHLREYLRRHHEQAKENQDPFLEAQYVKFIITENYGGSGVHISKIYAFGEPAQ